MPTEYIDEDVTSHSVPLSGLTPDTDYRARVRSTDPSNNTSTFSDWVTFTTDPAASEVRDAIAWPYAQDSIWNLPISTDATYLPMGFQPMIGDGNWAGLGSDDEIFALFESGDGPVRDVKRDDNEAWPEMADSCNPTISGTHWYPTYDYMQAYVPDGWMRRPGIELPSGTPNAAGAVLLTNGAIVEGQYFKRCTTTGPITFHYWIPTAGTSYDIQTGHGRNGAHGGSHLAAFGGSIRLGELFSADPIRHAVKMTFPMIQYGDGSGTGFRWPALKADTNFSTNYGSDRMGWTPPGGSNGVVMGSLLAIPDTVDIDTLGFETGPGAKLAWTVQNFGMYVTDESGWAFWYWNVELGVAGEMSDNGIALDTWSNKNTAWGRDMDRIITNLAEVTNQNSSNPGGGTYTGDASNRLHALAPAFA